MSKNSIQSWSVSVNGHEDDEDVEQGLSSGAKWDGTKEGWKSYLEGVRHALLSSSTKLRVNVLENEVLRVVRDHGWSICPRRARLRY